MEGEISFMKYFRINYGCGCGEEEEILPFETTEAAENFAYEMARENYYAYEGFHGVRDINDIALEDFGVEDLNEVLENNKTLYNDIEIAYSEEIENQLSYSVEELTEEEYLIAIGELDEDE